jgi:hypothetical protein
MLSTWPRKIAALAAACLLASGCSGSNESAQSAHDQNLSTMGNDLAGRTLTKPHDFTKSDGLTINTTYSTDYDVKSWKITSSKTLNIQLTVKPGEDAAKTQVQIEHMHADVSLISDNETLNGWPQDSMDSSIHGGDQPGFAVDATHPFNVVFSIEGFSQTLISGWGYATGDYGASQIDEKRLTESHLRDNGKVRGNKIIVIWVVLVKGANDPGFHEVSFQDEFAVPVG